MQHDLWNADRLDLQRNIYIYACQLMYIYSVRPVEKMVTSPEISFSNKYAKGVLPHKNGPMVISL